MNILQFIDELKAERDRIDKAITALEALQPIEPLPDQRATPVRKTRVVARVTAAGLKRCKDCGKSPAEVEFGKHAAFKDGLSNRCKGCHKKRLEAKRPSPQTRTATVAAVATALSRPKQKQELECRQGCGKTFTSEVWRSKHEDECRSRVPLPASASVAAAKSATYQ